MHDSPESLIAEAILRAKNEGEDLEAAAVKAGEAFAAGMLAYQSKLRPAKPQQEPQAGQ